MKSFKGPIALFLLIFLFFGCRINPAYIPIETSSMTYVYSPEHVNLVDAQKIKETMIGDNRKTDLTKWNKQAISLIKEWFGKNNIKVAEDAKKYLKISISDVSLSRTNLPCTHLTLNVETNTGLERSYTTLECAGSSDRSAGYAINYAVVELMHDGSIIKYLSE